MESESLSLQDEGEQSGDVIMSDNDIDPNYEPSEDEVLKYAIYLGIDPEEDRDFLYIAREGLKAPVAKPWRACQTRSGEIYYFNFETGDSQWDHPSDDIFRKKFQELKALCNKGGNHNKRGEQKLFRQMQKKHNVLQASKGSTIYEELNNENSSSNYDISGLQTDKENFINASNKKSPQNHDFDDNQLSLDHKDDTDNKEYNISQEPSNLHDIAQSFENFENFETDPAGDQSDIKLSTKKPEFGDSNIITDEAQDDIPETKNFYDEASLHHGSTVNVDFGGTGTKKSDFLIKDNNEESEIKKENNEESALGVPNGFEIKESQEFSQGWGSKISPKQNEGNVINSEEKGHEEKMFYEDSEHQGEQAQIEDQEQNEKKMFSLGEELGWDDHVENKLNFDNEKDVLSFDSHEPKGLNKNLETGSINFSDFKLGEESEKKSHKKRDSLIAVEELENDFSKLLREYEENLGAKFSEILGEYEQGYQNEALQIQQEYQNQILQIKFELEQSSTPERNSTRSLEHELSAVKRTFGENNTREIDEELQHIKENFEHRKREIEEMNNIELTHHLEEIKKKHESDLINLKEELEDRIEDSLEAVQKIKQDTFRGKEKFMNKGEFEFKKRELMKHFQEQLNQLEAEQNEMLEREAEVLKIELQETMENEKALLEEAYQQSQEEMKHLKVQIAESFKKNLEEEKNKLHAQHEKAIKQLETEELAKAEEIATAKAQQSLRGEYEKKFNAIQVERMLYEKQNKKRLEEIQLQALKKIRK